MYIIVTVYFSKLQPFGVKTIQNLRASSHSTAAPTAGCLAELLRRPWQGLHGTIATDKSLGRAMIIPQIACCSAMSATQTIPPSIPCSIHLVWISGWVSIVSNSRKEAQRQDQKANANQWPAIYGLAQPSSLTTLALSKNSRGTLPHPVVDRDLPNQNWIFLDAPHFQTRPFFGLPLWIFRDAPWGL